MHTNFIFLYVLKFIYFGDTNLFNIFLFIHIVQDVQLIRNKECIIVHVSS
jgi:hypothetical protein